MVNPVAGEHEAAVLLLDCTTGQVIQGNRTAADLTGGRPLPMAIDEWCRYAGLVEPDGHPLESAGHPFGRLLAGHAVDGEVVRRLVDGVLQRWWLTGLGVDASGAAAGQSGVALAVLVPVSGPREWATASTLHDLAVSATTLSMTISDPSQEDNPLIWVNPAFTRTTGYESAVVLGRNCRFLQGPDTDRDAVARIAQAIREERSITETLLNYRADGTTFWNEVSISPVLDAAGRLVNFVGVQSDVTARVEAEERRAQAHEAERRARSRLSLLAEVAEAVTELDTTVMLRRLARVLARDLLAWCAVVTREDDLRLVAVAGTDDHGHGRPFLLPRDRRLTGDAVAAQLTGDVRDVVVLDPTVDHPEDSLSRWLLNQVCAGNRSCRSIAIPGRRGVLGLLLAGTHADDLDGEDEALLLESARRVGLSLENARLYAREHLLAETLQQSMLPEQVSVPGLDLWSYYAPNVDHAQVGGDWYDVMQPDGAVGVVIGDVVGHDIEAAAAMGQLRSVVRAYAYEQDEPGTVLMRVDQLVRGMRISRTASLVYARLEEDGGGHWDMSWCRAGHLPPILIQDGKVRTLMEGGGTLVGLGERPRVTSSVRLSPGDVVVFYTDGLIERRARRLMDGLARLQSVCAALVATDAAGIGEQLLASLGKAPEDDMAIVVLRVPTDEPARSLGGDPRQRRWQLSGDPTSIGRARRLTVQTCTLWGLPVTGEAELVVSELVANAVLHGWGTIGLRLSHTGSDLLLEVEDGNPHPPAATEAERDGPGGYGLHVVARLSEWGWRRSGPGKVVWARVRIRS